jgi:hypothetical protein
MSVFSRFAVPVGDNWGDWIGGFHFDKLDLLPLSGDVLVQFRVNTSPQPEEGKPARAGLPVSWPGLSAVYKPEGPDAVRFKRRQAGVGATVDVDLWTPGA